MGVNMLIWKIVLDFLILATLGAILLVLKLVVDPYHRGYFEDDHSIRLPYKEQTVSEVLLAVIGFALIIITILSIEIVRDRRGKNVGEKFLSSLLVKGWIWESYSAIGIFTFGAACQQLTTNAAKYVIGRLRPHFYDVCRPVPVVNSSLNALGYIQEFTCSGTTDASKLKDMRLSFPSAHSSFSMYCAVFFIFYIQTKGKWRGSKLFRHGIQYLIFIAAWYVGLSRVSDHMHHWGDVAAGFAIGAAYGALVFIFILKPKKYGLPTRWENTDPQNPLPAVAR